MQIDNRFKIVLFAPVKCLLQKRKSFLVLLTILQPKLHFINRNANMVKAKTRKIFYIFFSKIVSPCFTPGLTLRKPVTNVCASFYNETTGVFNWRQSKSCCTNYKKKKEK